MPTVTTATTSNPPGADAPKVKKVEETYDEDCLKLNVWLPAGEVPEGGWPVYVWYVLWKKGERYRRHFIYILFVLFDFLFVFLRNAFFFLGRTN